MGDSIAYLCRDVSMGRGQNSNRAWRIGRDSNLRAASAATSLAKKRNRPDSATYPVSGQREIVYHGLTGVLSMRTGQNDHCARTCHGQVDDILLAASTYWKVVRIGKEPVPKTGVALRLGRSNRLPSANLVRCAGAAFSDCRSTVEHLTFNQGIAGSTPVSPTICGGRVVLYMLRPHSHG